MTDDRTATDWGKISATRRMDEFAKWLEGAQVDYWQFKRLWDAVDAKREKVYRKFREDKGRCF